MTLALLTAACTDAAEPATPGTPPTTDAPAIGTADRWRALRGACPTLTGDAATRLGKTGTGKPGPADVDTPVAQSINCTWGEGEGSVGVSLYLTRTDGPLPADKTTARDFQRSFDEYVADGSILFWKPEFGLEDHSYLGINKDRSTVELWTLSSNARITIYHQGPALRRSEWDSALTRERGTLRDLAADVIDDLS